MAAIPDAPCTSAGPVVTWDGKAEVVASLLSVE